MMLSMVNMTCDHQDGGTGLLVPRDPFLPSRIALLDNLVIRGVCYLHFVLFNS